MSEAESAGSARSDPAGFAGALLGWYDRHRRRLPWRALPGEGGDPYRVWLSEIMLQQTTVKAVMPYFERFTARWPDVMALAGAREEEVLAAWAGLGYYARARNLHACAKAVLREHSGRFPQDAAGLRKLPGVGDYTAGAIAAIAFGEKVPAVDGNVERVIARIDAIETPLPAARKAIRARVAALVPEDRPGDFAQALMDLGAAICTPRAPACSLCPWNAFCQARALGAQERFPVKPARTAKPRRIGTAYFARRSDGRVLVRRRPSRGLLAGTVEVPLGAFAESDASVDSLAPGEPPIPAAWRRVDGAVGHVFTHFALELAVFAADLGDAEPPEGAWWAPVEEIEPEVPTLIRKVIAHALARGA
jgi:A/G-specific adenine glycosylase